MREIFMQVFLQIAAFPLQSDGSDKRKAPLDNVEKIE